MIAGVRARLEQTWARPVAAGAIPMLLVAQGARCLRRRPAARDATTSAHRRRGTQARASRGTCNPAMTRDTSPFIVGRMLTLADQVTVPCAGAALPPSGKANGFPSRPT